MGDYQCPYAGECQIVNCFNVDYCYVKQVIEERNYAEKKYRELIEAQKEENCNFDRIKEIMEVWEGN